MPGKKEMFPENMNVHPSKLLVVAAVAFFLFSNGLVEHPAETQAKRPPENILTKTKKYVVGIECTVKGKQCFGTGFIVQSSGIIATAPTTVPPHEAKDITVQRMDNASHSAEILSVHENKDLVLLQIDGENFPVAPFANSKQAQPGQVVYSIGNGERILERSGELYTGMGILSGRYPAASDDEFVPAKFGKTVRDDNPSYYPVKRTDHYGDVFLETTAPLNQGRDGGVLINLKGEVLGMLSLSYSRHRWLGLAIPINELKESITNALEERDLERNSPEAFERLETELHQTQKQFTSAFRNAQKWTVAIQVKRESTEKPSDSKKTEDFLPPSPVTGTIMSSDGYIVTNRYRLKKPGDIKSLTVILPDGTKKSGRIVKSRGGDVDLVLIKVDAQGLEVPSFAPESSYVRGKFALGVGRAPAPDYSNVTQGNIATPPGEKHHQFLVNTKINPGNVGGPIVGVDGKLLGITVHYDRVNPNQELNMVLTPQRIKDAFSPLK